MSNHNIVILDGYVAGGPEYDWQDFHKLGNVKVYDRTTTREDVTKRAKDATAIYTNKVVIDDDLMESMPNLEFIGVLATGYNNVDIDAAHRRGITVTNVPAYSTESVSQTVFAHLLNIATRVSKHARSVRKGAWQHCGDFSFRLTPIFEICNRTMGIYGLGNIGMRVAQIAHAFGMNVVAFTSKDKNSLPSWLMKADTFDKFLASADIFTLHAPLTADNWHIINAETIAKMRPGSIIINTARGGLIDGKAVADALISGHLRAFASDVLETEPPTEGDPLIDAPNSFVSPHIAWQSEEARNTLLKVAASNLEAFINGEPINVV